MSQFQNQNKKFPIMQRPLKLSYQALSFLCVKFIDFQVKCHCDPDTNMTVIYTCDEKLWKTEREVRIVKSSSVPREYTDSVVDMVILYEDLRKTTNNSNTYWCFYESLGDGNSRFTHVILSTEPVNLTNLLAA